MEDTHGPARRRGSAASTLAADIAALPDRSYAELQSEWRRLYRSPPPKKLSRDVLELGIAWKLQEAALNGLTAASKRQVEALANTVAAGGEISKPRAVRLKVGARFVREWNGDTHDVLVVKGGFRWRDATWPSLSAIAREITGTRWSGPRFFGLPDGTVAAPVRSARSEAVRPAMARRNARADRQVAMPVQRCAIYTRKSSEEGLEQAFNSLDTQRETCEAYVLSQKHEGRVVLPAIYDDAGLSGGTLERPTLQRLLADIAARKVDTVVVYKVHRLTRSLVDFAKIVEVFERHGVTFVSVTQSFNTTTSMSRLTLNMLLSFAQFEREVAGERIRDKISASKRKGMWMGGLPPLGYDVTNLKLVINDAEAETIRSTFRRCIELGSVRALQDDLAVTAS